MKDSAEKANGTQSENLIATVSKYYLLYMLFAFLGWLWEVFYVRFEIGRFVDRGFMWLPFCPIYGTALFIAYFLLGTPDEGRGILKNVKNSFVRYALYALFAFLIPTLTELIIGLFFDKVLGVTLWDYSALPLNLGGYICLPVALVWTVAITLFMRFAFKPLKNLIFRLPDGVAIFLSVALFCAMCADVAVNLFINCPRR
ncbi:MAG: putative ABC transporter permease [Candidatus Coproplasma sp.]